jgi:hypothetical protein
MQILEGKFAEGDRIIVDVSPDGKQLQFTREQ